MINNSGTKIWMNTYNKPKDSKCYVLFTSNHPRHCLKNIPLSLARRICTVVENEYVKEKRFKKPKKNIARIKYPKLLIEANILKAKEILLEVLRQQKTNKTIPFTTT